MIGCAERAWTQAGAAERHGHRSGGGKPDGADPVRAGCGGCLNRRRRSAAGRGRAGRRGGIGGRWFLTADAGRDRGWVCQPGLLARFWVRRAGQGRRRGVRYQEIGSSLALERLRVCWSSGSQTKLPFSSTKTISILTLVFHSAILNFLSFYRITVMSAPTALSKLANSSCKVLGIGSGHGAC